MSAGNYPIEVEQGATYRRTFTVTNDASPFDLTGCIIRMQVRAKVTSPDVLAEKTTVNSSITVNPLEGEFTFTFTDEESAAWDWRKGVYDVEVELPGGDVIRLFEGTFTVKPEVTR